MNKGLAKKLNVTIGDIVELIYAELTPEKVLILVLDIVEESVTRGCYISENAMRRYFCVGDIGNSIILKVEPKRLDQVKKSIINTKNISSVTDTKRTLKNYKKTMESMIIMVNIFSILSVLAGMILTIR